MASCRKPEEPQKSANGLPTGLVTHTHTRGDDYNSSYSIYTCTHTSRETYCMHILCITCTHMHKHTIQSTILSKKQDLCINVFLVKLREEESFASKMDNLALYQWYSIYYMSFCRSLKLKWLLHRRKPFLAVKVSLLFER